MIKAHFFDLNTLIGIKQYCWIVDKTNPNIPIMKISKSDFNLIKSGIYKSQGNKVEFNGQTFWLPNDISNKLKVKLKTNRVSIGNIGISMQEFLNGDIIKDIDFKLNLDNIIHLKNTSDDIYIICSKQTKKSYESIIDKLKEKLFEEGLKIKNFYFISETFYNSDNDDIKYNKIKLLIQHLVGYKTENNKFIDQEIERYDSIYFYDDELDTIKMSDEINVVLKFLLSKTDDGLKSVIKEDIKEYRPSLFINQITDNNFNRSLSKKVILDYTSLIKTFESFKESLSTINELFFEIPTEEFESKVFGEDDDDFDYSISSISSKKLNYVDENWIKFTEKEISSLINMLPHYLLTLEKLKCFDPQYRRQLISENSYILIFDDKGGNDVLTIYKAKDEWFYVCDERFLNTYYKCDQFDGLVSCIKNII